MATNYVQEGAILNLIAPADVVSGGVVTIGKLIGVAVHSAKTGQSVQVQVEGVFDLAKTAADAITAGLEVFWDATAGSVTSTVGTNTRLGLAVADAGLGATVARVKLNA